jgi:Rrf2 family protein
MKINTKTRYGLRTLLELALNNDNQIGIYQKEISERQNISNRYLDHIIASLKTAGLVTNVGGKKSGYKLSKKPSEISMYDVYKAFDNKMQIIDCLVDDNNCPGKQSCSAREFWQDLNNCTSNYMESVKLTDIAERQKSINKTKTNVMYHI